MRRDELYLADLVRAAREVLRFVQGVDEARWHTDTLVQSAVLHQLTIIGEVARALPPTTQARHSDIPWSRMRGFRNVVVHAYFAVDWERVWFIVQDDVPVLAARALDALRVESPALAQELEDEE